MSKKNKTAKRLLLPVFAAVTAGIGLFVFNMPPPDYQGETIGVNAADTPAKPETTTESSSRQPVAKATQPAKRSMSTTGGPSVKSSPNGTVVKTSNSKAVMAYAKENNLTVEKVTPLPGGHVLMAIAEPKQHPKVLALEQSDLDAEISTNYTYRALYTPTNPDTHYASQWNLDKIQAPAAWDFTTGSSSSVIAIIDTGVLFSQTVNGTTYTQPDFPESRRWKNPAENGSTLAQGAAPNCTSRGLSLDKSCNNLDDDNNGKVDDWQGWDFMGGFNGSGAQCPNHNPAFTADSYFAEDNDPQPYSCDSPTDPSALNKDHYNGTCEFGVSSCYLGHGTMVGSVAAATSNNGQLIAGIDHAAQVMNLRVLDGYGYTTTDLVAASVAYAGAQGADVINMSLAVSDCSGSFVDPVLEDAMRTAKASGSVIVAASGNENIASVCYPASSPHAIAVGSTDSNDQRSSFSNYGHGLDVVAPGSGIPVANAPSASINSTYHASANGTSLATPHVAGLAGLIKAMKPSASVDEITDLIKDRADIVPSMQGKSFSVHLGYGRINTYNSIRVAQGTSRPIYRLYNATRNCAIYTSSANQKRYIEKIDYLYQAIDRWEAVDSTSVHSVTKSRSCGQ